MIPFVRTREGRLFTVVFLRCGSSLLIRRSRIAWGSSFVELKRRNVYKSRPRLRSHLVAFNSGSIDSLTDVRGTELGDESVRGFTRAWLCPGSVHFLSV
jgi:hypothetical protein